MKLSFSPGVFNLLGHAPPPSLSNFTPPPPPSLRKIIFLLLFLINIIYIRNARIRYTDVHLIFTLLFTKQPTVLTRILLKTATGIHLLSKKAICLCAQARRNALSQRVSTALRCLGLKITLFKLTRLKTREN